MIPVDVEARIYFALALILAATVVLLLVVALSALRAADRADRRAAKAAARSSYLDNALAQAKAALASWREWDRPRPDHTGPAPKHPMRVVPISEPAQRPGLADTIGEIT